MVVSFGLLLCLLGTSVVRSGSFVTAISTVVVVGGSSLVLPLRPHFGLRRGGRCFLSTLLLLLLTLFNNLEDFLDASQG